MPGFSGPGVALSNSDPLDGAADADPGVSSQASRSDHVHKVSGEVPIGGIIPWYPSITGVPALPNGWQLCDGSAINNVLSPMNGQNTPSLAGGRRFLSGNTTSGGTGTEDFLPSHNHTQNSHTHSLQGVNYGDSNGVVGVQLGNGSTGESTFSGAVDSTTATNNNASSGTAWNFTNVVYIIRIY